MELAHSHVNENLKTSHIAGFQKIDVSPGVIRIDIIWGPEPRGQDLCPHLERYQREGFRVLSIARDGVFSSILLKSTCPDCKDGYYYPFMREREPCETCS